MPGPALVSRSISSPDGANAEAGEQPRWAEIGRPPRGVDRRALLLRSLSHPGNRFPEQLGSLRTAQLEYAHSRGLQLRGTVAGHDALFASLLNRDGIDGRTSQKFRGLVVNKLMRHVDAIASDLSGSALSGFSAGGFARRKIAMLRFPGQPVEQLVDWVINACAEETGTRFTKVIMREDNGEERVDTMIFDPVNANSSTPEQLLFLQEGHVVRSWLPGV